MESSREKLKVPELDLATIEPEPSETKKIIEPNEIPDNNLKFFSSGNTIYEKLFGELMVNDPDKFMEKLLLDPDWDLDTAKKLDRFDLLLDSKKKFETRFTISFDTDSARPVFNPAISDLYQSYAKREQYTDNSEKLLMEIMQDLTGFTDTDEFIFTTSHSLQNIQILMRDFYQPEFRKIKKNGKFRNKIVVLDIEYYTNLARKIISDELEVANRYQYFPDNKPPGPESLMLKIPPEEIYFSPDDITWFISKYAAEIQMIILPEVIADTGQRLDFEMLFSELSDIIRENNIIVGLDFSHSMIHRKINLKIWPITFAVGWSDEYLSGFNKNLSAIYVSLNAKGALKYRLSIPTCTDLHPAKSYLTYFYEEGFDKYFNKSECLIRYLITLLKNKFHDAITFITPLEAKERGNKITFQINNLKEVSLIDDCMKSEFPGMGFFRIEARQPNIISLSIHYGYISFKDIFDCINKLSFVMQQVPHINQVMEFSIIETNKMFDFDWNNACTVDHWEDIVKAVHKKACTTNLGSIVKDEEKEIYALLNYKLGTYYLYIEQVPARALERLYIAEKYYADHEKKHKLQLAWTKMQCVYAYQMLTSMDKSNHAEANIPKVTSYKSYTITCLKQVDHMFELEDEMGQRSRAWIKLMGFAKYVSCLATYEFHLHDMISLSTCDVELLEADVANAISCLHQIFGLFSKIDLMDDMVANMKNHYALFLSKTKKYEEAQNIYEELDKYWSKCEKQDNLYIKKFCENYTAFKNKRILFESTPSPTRTISRRRLSDLVMYPHKHQSIEKKEVKDTKENGPKISPRQNKLQSSSSSSGGSTTRKLSS